MTLEARILLTLMLIGWIALGFGLYEIMDQGLQISEEESNLRRIWTAAGELSLLSSIGIRLADRRWRKLIVGLDTSGLPTMHDIDEVRNSSTGHEAEWIADVSEGFWQSGFCYDRTGKITNGVSIAAGGVSAALLGFALFNPVSGVPAVLGIATGSVSLGGLAKELFSIQRFEYWEGKRPQIQSRWRALI